MSKRLGAKMVGAKVSYAQAVLIVSFAWVPRLVHGLVNTIQKLMMDTTNITSMHSFGFSPARFMDPDSASKAALAIAGRFDLFTIWLTILIGIGISAFSTIFIAIIVGLLESFEPEPHKLFDLKIRAKDAPAIRPRVQLILRRNKVRYELRSAGEEEIVYETRVPAGRKTDGITEAIRAIDAANEVEWEEKKPK